MGYRSQVRILIYGEPDRVLALTTAHALTSKINIFEEDVKHINRYSTVRRIADEEAIIAQTVEGKRPWITREVTYDVIDLTGEDWKWYTEYEGVQAWVDLMASAADMGCCYEFIRIGEDTGDIEEDCAVEDGGDHYLGVSRSIYCDLPSIDEEQEQTIVVVKELNKTETVDG